LHIHIFVPTHLDAARTIADQCLCFRARRTARLITRLYDDALRPLGLQPTQLTLLSAITLLARRHGGPVPLGVVADTLALDVTTLSRNVRALEKAGHVRLVSDAADRRVRLTSLTPTGERMLAKAAPLWAEAHARIVEALGATQATNLQHALDAAAQVAMGELEVSAA
jgi:DNA-binding MarR family transcriptional regulator